VSDFQGDVPGRALEWSRHPWATRPATDPKWTGRVCLDASVMAGYSVLRIRLGDTAVQADLQAIGRSSQGRLIKQDVRFDQLARGGIPPAPPKRGEWPVLPYFSFAALVVVAGGVLAAPSDSRFLVGYVLYSLIALFWVVTPNLAAYFSARTSRSRRSFSPSAL